MAAITQTCTKCGKQFLIIDAEQQFLSERGLPNPTICPTDRQAKRLELRGKRELFKTKCSKCGKDIIVSFNPQSVTAPILCKEDYDRYFEEKDAIINEPLPGETSGAVAPIQQTPPTSFQQPPMVPQSPMPAGPNVTPQQSQQPTINSQPVPTNTNPSENQQ